MVPYGPLLGEMIISPEDHLRGMLDATHGLLIAKAMVLAAAEPYRAWPTASTVEGTRMGDISALIEAIKECRSDDDRRDEIFWEVSARIRGQGEACRLDLLALAAWWLGQLDQSTVARLTGTKDATVRDVTRRAFASGLTDSERLDWLEGLPVLGDGRCNSRWWFPGHGPRPRWTRIQDASPLLVLLACWNPDKFCIGGRVAIDYGLWSIPQPVYPGRETLDYLETVRKLRDLCCDSIPDATALDVDQGLRILGDRRRRRRSA